MSDPGRFRRLFNHLRRSPLSEAEIALRAWRVPYIRGEGESLIIPGHLNLIGMELSALPNLTNVSVMGDFLCASNRLSSLKGAPFYVERDCDVSGNVLVTLEGSPRYVGGEFDCRINHTLRSLKGAPRYVGGAFICKRTGLSSLEYLPTRLGRLISDYGIFSSPSEIPAEIREHPVSYRGHPLRSAFASP